MCDQLMFYSQVMQQLHEKESQNEAITNHRHPNPSDPSKPTKTETGDRNVLNLKRQQRDRI